MFQNQAIIIAHTPVVGVVNDAATNSTGVDFLIYIMTALLPCLSKEAILLKTDWNQTGFL